MRKAADILLHVTDYGYSWSSANDIQKRYSRIYKDKVYCIVDPDGETKLKVYLGKMGRCDFDGPVENLVDLLQSYSDQGTYFDIEIDTDMREEYGSTYFNAHILGYRYETQDEIVARTELTDSLNEKAKAETKAQREAAKAKELAELERLKKKYEKAGGK